MNEANSQLRAVHIILAYTPISLTFQAPKCVIRAKDPRFHRIRVAYEGFVVPEGVPIPEGTSLAQPLFLGIPSVEASPSQPIVKEEEEEEEKEEEVKEKEPGEIVDLSDSQDEFEVFNRPLSLENTSADLIHQQKVGIVALDEMGIQRKSKRSLLDLIESQPGKDAPGKSAQPQLPPLPPKLPPPPP